MASATVADGLGGEGATVALEPAQSAPGGGVRRLPAEYPGGELRQGIGPRLAMS